MHSQNLFIDREQADKKLGKMKTWIYCRTLSHLSLCADRCATSFIAAAAAAAILSKQAIMPAITQKWQITCVRHESASARASHTLTPSVQDRNILIFANTTLNLLSEDAVCARALLRIDKIGTILCSIGCERMRCRRVFFVESNLSYSNMLSINLRNFSLWHDARALAKHTMETVSDAGPTESIIFENQWRAHTSTFVVQFVRHAATAAVWNWSTVASCNDFCATIDHMQSDFVHMLRVVCVARV